MDAISPGLVRRLKQLSVRRPALGLRAAGAFGARLRPGSYWAPSPAEVRAVFGVAEPRAAARLCRQIGSRELRNHVAGAITSKCGMDVLRDCIHVVGGEHLLELRREKVPAVVVFWHLGTFRAVPAALSKLGLPSLVASKRPPRRDSQHLEFQRAQGPLAGARFLKDALAHLGDAGCVALSLDCREDEAFCQVDFLGRPVYVARGAVLLARLARARLVPATSRWIGASGHVEVVIHEPVPEPRAGQAPERAGAELLEGAVRPFVDHVRAHPEDLRLCALRTLLGVELS